MPALVCVAWLVSLADAGQLSHTGSVPLTTTNWSTSVTIPKFDPALGVLQAVVIRLDAHNEGSAAFESGDAAPTTVTMSFSSRIDVLRPDNSSILFAQPTVNTSDVAGAFDGTLDFGGTSGKLYPNLTQTVTQSHASPRPIDDLALFSGPAGNPGNIALPVTAQGLSTGTGAGNLTLSFTSQASAEVTVSYLFFLDCNGNNIPDDEDTGSGTSADCDHNSVPDECQSDCDADGIPNVCEVDCDHDGTPDDCDLTPCPDCLTPNHRNPGSLLLFPEFDNSATNLTLITVTNTNCEQARVAEDSGIDVEFVYVGRFGHDHVDLPCLETNRTRHLSPCDTVTIWTSFDNPNQEQGYVYVFAKDRHTGRAVVFNHLIGQEMLISSTNQLDDGINALVFQGVGEQGAETDHDHDGIRDLDGVEYDEAPAELLIPRFLGTDPPGTENSYASRLILIGLSGGTAFTTTVNFLVFNDNEEVFSAQYSFFCWDNPFLNEINNIFSNDFLKYSTNNAPGEVVGAPERESGWMRINGLIAHSSATEITDPAVYAVLIERVTPFAVADLPFELCTQDNGDLLPTDLFGDH